MSIPKEDRAILQFFIDHLNDDFTAFTNLITTRSARGKARGSNGEISKTTVWRRLDEFCATYQCGARVQITDWERVGLHSFFVLSWKPLDHPYAIRQFKMVGERVRYLTQYVTPDPYNLPRVFERVYPVSRVYCKNSIQLLYQETRTLSFTEEWLLTLKEVMVEQGVGDLVLPPPEEVTKSPIPITSEFLDRLSKIYLIDGLGRIHQRYAEFIRNYTGFLTTYLNLQLPEMVNYILILNKVDKPSSFTGGLINLFPLVEIYEGKNTLIYRFQLPDPNFSRLHTNLYLLLQEICTPYLYLLLEDTRFFRLGEQWREGRWDKFTLIPSSP